MRQNLTDMGCYAISLQTIRPEPLQRERLDEQKKERQKEKMGNRRRDGRIDGKESKQVATREHGTSTLHC